MILHIVYLLFFICLKVEKKSGWMFLTLWDQEEKISLSLYVCGRLRKMTSGMRNRGWRLRRRSWSNSWRLWTHSRASCLLHCLLWFLPLVLFLMANLLLPGTNWSHSSATQEWLCGSSCLLPLWIHHRITSSAHLWPELLSLEVACVIWQISCSFDCYWFSSCPDWRSLSSNWKFFCWVIDYCSCHPSQLNFHLLCWLFFFLSPVNVSELHLSKQMSTSSSSPPQDRF